jgi:hypothetical protein
LPAKPFRMSFPPTAQNVVNLDCGRFGSPSSLALLTVTADLQ